MPRYAQIDMETGHIKVISNLRDEGMEKEYPHLIPINDNFNKANKKWDFETKTWVNYEPEPIPDPRPTQADRIEAKADYLLMTKEV